MRRGDSDERLCPGTPPGRDRDGSLGTLGCSGAAIRAHLHLSCLPCTSGGGGGTPESPGVPRGCPRVAARVAGCTGRTRDTVAFCCWWPREQGPGLHVPSLRPRRRQDWRPTPGIWGLKSRRQPQPRLTRQARRQASSSRAHAPQQVRWRPRDTGLPRRGGPGGWGDVAVELPRGEGRSLCPLGRCWLLASSDSGLRGKRGQRQAHATSLSPSPHGRAGTPEPCSSWGS